MTDRARLARAQPRSARKRSAAPGQQAGGAAITGPAALDLMQRTAGNRAVSSLARMGRDEGEVDVQRVPVTLPSRQETLFNRPSGAGGGQRTARVYGSSAGRNVDMTRTDTPARVVVTVRIRFVSQARDANGRNTGPQTAIPASDERRAWAQGVCSSAPGVWNNRARLVGERAARTGLMGRISPDPGGTVRLPLVFRAQPVWDLTSPADKTIAVFGSATVAGGNQHPIDAAHYYMNRGNYPFSEQAIYAHEYGHLIGLPDEYSHSNPQMHALLHEIDPGTAAARSAALDRATVQRVVMAALTRPLFDRLSGARGELARAFARSSSPVSAALAREMRTALGNPTVAGLLASNLPPVSARLSGRIPGLLSATARSGIPRSVARRVVRAELDPAALGALVDRQYFAALSAVDRPVDVGGIGMHINVHGNAGITSGGQAVTPPTGLWNAAMSGPSAADAGAVVDQVVGAAGTGGRVPPVRPPTSVLRQLSSLPSAWGAFAVSAPSALSSGTLQTDMTSALLSAWIARVTSAAAPAATITRSRTLASQVRAAVSAAATAAATNAVRAFLTAEITPVLQSSVTTLQAAVRAEVDRVMGTPAGALAAAAPRDPHIAALATSLRARLQAEFTAATTSQAATPGTTAVNPGAAAPPQSVTYGTVNMMSDNEGVFRADQFAAMATQFNSSGLRRDREGEFRVEMV